MTERTAEQLLNHYRIEKELALKLLTAPKLARQRLYGEVYDELFRRIPDHPQLARKASEAETRANTEVQMRVLAPFLEPGSTYLEIGPGDCSVAFAAAARVQKAYAVDVSGEITSYRQAPANFTLVLTRGTEIPVPAACVDVAYSSDLIEHLHPEDAMEQLANIYAALAPGGRYICVTPNRLSGPWDISGLFSPVAEGFHLKEYTVGDLGALFKRAGFSRIRILARLRKRFICLPAWWFIPAENLLARLPHRLRKRLAMRLRRLSFEYIRLVGTK